MLRAISLDLNETKRASKSAWPIYPAGQDRSYLELPGNLFETAFKIAAALHQILYVEYVRKEEFQQLQELGLGVGQIAVGKHLDQVAEIVRTVKRDPGDLVK